MPYYPLFFDLTDRPVLVVGGGKTALEKVIRLKPSKASISVVAPELDPEFFNISGIDLLKREWRAEDLEGRFLVIAATDQPSLNRTISLGCAQRRILCNVVDSAAHSSAVFGSVILDGDLAIGISTSGSSPSAAVWLKNEIRARIPDSFGEILAFLRRIRPKILHDVSKEKRSRLFHGLFEACLKENGPLDSEALNALLRSFDLPALEPAAADPSMPAFKKPENGSRPAEDLWAEGMTETTDDSSRTENQKPGIVFLIGAGCHDAGWLTQQAAELVKGCDALVYDELLDPKICRLASGAELYFRGKRGGRPGADQQEINELLKTLAFRHRCVVRLKGGDPTIFGRGMEEAEFLESCGIPVRIVPGISSITGIPAKELFGLTRRNQASGFMVLSARQAGGMRSRQEWEQIASFQGTVVFLMGMSQIGSIANHLMEAGMDPLTPAAVLSSPAMTLTASISTVLKDLESKSAAAGLSSPGLIVIGGSAAGFKPLNPVRIGLCTSESFGRRLEALLPAQFQCCSLLELCYTDYPLDFTVPEKPSWLVFTSPHGAGLFLEALRRKKTDLRRLADCRLACIGKTTAAVFEKAGLFADLTARPESSFGLLSALFPRLKPEEKVFLFQSAKASPVLKEGLGTQTKLEAHTLYDFEFLPSWKGESEYVVLSSLSAAKAWLDLEKRPDCRCLIVLSQRIEQALRSDPRFEKIRNDVHIRIPAGPYPQNVADEILADFEQRKKNHPEEKRAG